MYSKHQNLQAEPNKPRLDPYYHRHGRSGNVMSSLMLVVIGIILGIPAGAAMSAGIRSYDAPARTCQTCHNATTTPQADLTSYGKYRRFHQRSAHE